MSCCPTCHKRRVAVMSVGGSPITSAVQYSRDLRRQVSESDADLGEVAPDGVAQVGTRGLVVDKRDEDLLDRRPCALSAVLDRLDVLLDGAISAVAEGGVRQYSVRKCSRDNRRTWR